MRCEHTELFWFPRGLSLGYVLCKDCRREIVGVVAWKTMEKLKAQYDQSSDMDKANTERWKNPRNWTKGR